MTTVRAIRPQYTVQLKVGSDDLTMRLQSVSIVNSIKTIYPVILLKLNMSSKDYFLNQIYGQKDVRLEIVVTGESTVPSEVTKLDLIIIHMENKVSMQKNTEDTNESNQMEDSVVAVALLKDAYAALSTTINLVYNYDESNDGNGGMNEIQRLRDFINQGISLSSNFVQTVDQVLATISSTIFSVNNDILSTFYNLNNIENGINSIIDRGYDISNTKGLRISQKIDYNTNIYGGFGQASIGSGLNKVVKDEIKKLSRKNANAIYGGVKNSVNNFLPSIVNSTLNNSGKHVPLSVTLDLVNNFLKDIKTNIDFSNKNNTEIDQIVIPPRSFIGAIRYLNDRYGIYKGPLFIYCDLENTLNMWDLSKATDRPILYTVDFLARGLDDTQVMMRSSETDKNFYTYQPIKVKNKTNTSLMNNGYEHIITKSPRNKFFENIKMNLDEIVQDFSISSRPEIICNDVAKKKKTVHSIGVNGTSEDEDNAFITSKLSQFINSASMFSFKLKGTKLPIKNLSKVGGCIQFIPHVTEYLPYSGKYIVASSVIVISREKSEHYICDVEVTCFRESLES